MIVFNNKASNSFSQSGFAVFAQLDDVETNPVLPVDFRLCTDLTCAYDDTSWDEEGQDQAICKYVEQQLNGTDVKIGLYNDRYAGKNMEISIFKTAEDAAKMMNAAQLGFGGAEQNVFLLAAARKLFDGDKDDKAYSRFKVDLEMAEFAVYKVKTENGQIWGLESSNPVTSYTEQYKERHGTDLTTSHPAVLALKAAGIDFNFGPNVQDEDFGEFIELGKVKQVLSKYQSAKQLGYSIDDNIVKLTPRLDKQTESVAEFTLVPCGGVNCFVGQSLEEFNKTDKKYFVFKYNGKNFGIENISLKDGLLTIRLTDWGKVFSMNESAYIRNIMYDFKRFF